MDSIKEILQSEKNKTYISSEFLKKQENRTFFKKITATFYKIRYVENVKITFFTKTKCLSFVYPFYQKDILDKTIFKLSKQLSEPLIINNGEPLSKEIPTKVERSYLIWPMKINNQSIGFVTFRNKLDSDYFDKADRTIIQLTVQAVENLLSNLWITEENELNIPAEKSLPFMQKYITAEKEIIHYEIIISEILKLSRMINSTIGLDQLLSSIMESSKMVLKTEGSSLMLLDDKKENLIFRVVSGEKDNDLKKITIPIGKGIAGEVALKKEAEVVNDVQNDPRHFKAVDSSSNFITRNLLATPLMVKNDIIGVLEAINTIGRLNFKKKDLQRFRTFSEQAALAIHNRDLIRSLQEANKNLQKRVSELSSLHKFSQQITRTLSTDEILKSYLNILKEQFDPYTISILIYDNDKKKLIIQYAHGLPKEVLNTEVNLENTLAGEVFQSRRSFFTNDLRSTKYTKYYDEKRYQNGNCILYYLDLNGKPFGIVNLSKKDSVHYYQKSDLRLLITITSQLVQAISNYSLVEEMIDKKAYEKELQITSDIQRAILPSNFIDNKKLQLSHYYQPAKIMGGDFFDYSVIEKGVSHFSIADVSGKSLPAALFMALASSIVRTVFQTEKSPSRILAIANDLIYRNSQSGMFVTMFLASYNPEVNMLSYSSAGHNQQILLKKESNEPELLNAHGKPLGILESSMITDYEEIQIPFFSGDLLILYTDGVIESINPEKEEYGIERFIKKILEFRDYDFRKIANLIYEDVKKFCGNEPQFDDFTLMIIKLK